MSPPEVKKEVGFSASYVEFARTLRTWFVAYGIGAPVLVLSQDGLRQTIAARAGARTLGICFLAGVGLQIVASLTYKIAMWYLYMGELDEGFTSTRQYQWSERISVALWLELLFDIGTLTLFGYATIRLLSVLAP